MNRRAWFAYVRGLKAPSPVVFYDDIPLRDGKPTETLRIWEIDGGTGHAHFFPGADETPSFARLTEFFPIHPAEPAPQFWFLPADVEDKPLTEAEIVVAGEEDAL